jgi:hypothetical protein
MYDKTSYDLFMECRSCGVENMITDYNPSMRIFCSQCRERLVDDDLKETHFEYICQECDMRLVLLQTTEVKLGESACSCGSTDVLKIGLTTLPNDVLEAGGLIDPDEKDDPILEDTDWLRPAGSGEITDDDYEDMFNQDPGQN